MGVLMHLPSTNYYIINNLWFMNVYLHKSKLQCVFYILIHLGK